MNYMRLSSIAVVGTLVVVLAGRIVAQDLAPRAYVITPVNSNAATLAWSFYDGGVNFNGAVPVKNGTGAFSVPVLSLYHSFSFFGRSGNVVGSLPYGVGTFGAN